MIWWIQEVVLSYKGCDRQYSKLVWSTGLKAYLQWLLTFICIERSGSNTKPNNAFRLVFNLVSLFCHIYLSLCTILVRSAQDPWWSNEGISCRSIVIVSVWICRLSGGFLTFLTLRDFSWSPGILRCCSLSAVAIVSSFASFCWKKPLSLQCGLVPWVSKVSPPAVCWLHLWESEVAFLDFFLSRCHPRSLWLLNTTPPSQSTKWLEMGQLWQSLNLNLKLWGIVSFESHSSLHHLWSKSAKSFKTLKESWFAIECR